MTEAGKLKVVPWEEVFSYQYPLCSATVPLAEHLVVQGACGLVPELPEEVLAFVRPLHEYYYTGPDALRAFLEDESGERQALEETWLEVGALEAELFSVLAVWQRPTFAEDYLKAVKGSPWDWPQREGLPVEFSIYSPGFFYLKPWHEFSAAVEVVEEWLQAHPEKQALLQELHAAALERPPLR